jgi:hypothetical protein
MESTNEQLRAAKGGEHGINGEFYAGGTFLPNTQKPKTKRRKGSGKRQVGPFRWEVAPADGLVPLYPLFYDLINLRTGEVLEQACRYYGRTPEQVRKMAAAWQNGILWIAAA